MTIYFVSDIHLSDDTPEINALFFDFLETTASQGVDLYILGDLMDRWVGDDLPTQTAVRLRTHLQKRRLQGLSTYYLPGNRDFLLGKNFCTDCGMTYLSDPSLLSLFGVRILATHGDALCLSDVRYQRFRYWVRQPLLQWLFLRLPRVFRLAIANRLRQASYHHQKSLSDAQMDVSDTAVTSLSHQYKATLCIHGHVHLAGVYQYGDFQRWVLADWQPTKGSVIALQANEIQLLTYQMGGVLQTISVAPIPK